MKQQISEKGGCLRKAFSVGLAYMGRNEDVSFIPDNADLVDVERAAKHFGLTWVNQVGSYSYNGPLIVIYRTDSDDPDDGLPVDHAVFASDCAPFNKHEVITTIIGWNGDHSVQWARPPIPIPMPTLSRWRRFRRWLGKLIIA